MFDYTNPNFDIRTIEGFDNIDGLKEISSYLDFALSTTIHTQLPKVDIKSEKMYARKLLENFFNNDTHAFTRNYRIRENMNYITSNKVRNLLLKSLIERYAYSQRICHMLSATTTIDQYAEYATNMIASGKLDDINTWITGNLSIFIEDYVNTRYKEDNNLKKDYETIAYSIPNTNKALEQLNLEMHLHMFKTK